MRIIAENVYDLATVRKRWAKGLKLACNGNASAARLAEILQPFRPGEKAITIAYRNARVGGRGRAPGRMARQPRRGADRSAARLAQAGERAGRVLTGNAPSRTRDSARAPRSATRWRSSPRRRGSDAVLVELAFTLGPALIALLLAIGTPAIAFAAAVGFAAIAVPVFLAFAALEYWRHDVDAERHLLGPLTAPRLLAVYAVTTLLTFCLGLPRGRLSRFRRTSRSRPPARPSRAAQSSAPCPRCSSAARPRNVVASDA